MTISEYQVMHSNAGFYVGRAYYDEDLQAELPYDRASGYFRKREEAEKELRFVQYCNEE